MENLLGLLFPRDSGRGVESLRLLTQAEYEGYEAAHATLARFFQRRAYVLCRQMYRQFIATYGNHERKLKASQGRSPMRQGDIVFDLNSRLALWLEAFRIFLNHAETDIIRLHGKSSEHWRSWVEAKGRLFDEEVAYRFMYHLRNYLHVAMPVTDITLSSWLVETGVTQSNLQVRFSRDDLLAHKEWHSRVEADLAAMPSHFSVLPLAIRLNECIDVLMRTLIESDLDGALEAARIIEGFSSEAMSAPGAIQLCAQPIVMSEIAEDHTTGKLQLTFSQIPMSWIPLVRKAAGGELTIFGVEDQDNDSDDLDDA